MVDWYDADTLLSIIFNKASGQDLKIKQFHDSAHTSPRPEHYRARVPSLSSGVRFR